MMAVPSRAVAAGSVAYAAPLAVVVSRQFRQPREAVHGRAVDELLQRHARGHVVLLRAVNWGERKTSEYPPITIPLLHAPNLHNGQHLRSDVSSQRSKHTPQKLWRCVPLQSMGLRRMP